MNGTDVAYVVVRVDAQGGGLPLYAYTDEPGHAAAYEAQNRLAACQAEADHEGESSARYDVAAVPLNEWARGMGDGA